MTSSCLPATSIVAPRRLSTLPMTCTSEMSGTFVSVVTPEAIRDAAMSLRAEFFAPSTVTSPVMGWPPSTRITSMSLLGLAAEAA